MSFHFPNPVHTALNDYSSHDKDSAEDRRDENRFTDEDRDKYHRDEGYTVDEDGNFSCAGGELERRQPENESKPHFEESNIGRSDNPLPGRQAQLAQQRRHDQAVDKTEEEIEEEFDRLAALIL